MTTQNSRIIGLKVRNVKRLQAVDFTPGDEAVIGVGGKNASGKTSLLDSIMYALGGTKSIPDDAVRKGAKKGEIEVELDDYVVKRILTSKGSRLEIKGKDGKPYASPQTLLDDMTGKLTFDPLRFQRLCDTPAGRREQAEMLRALVNLDFKKLDDERATHFSNRTDVNRELKQVTAALETKPHFSNMPKKEVSIAALSSKLQEALEQNAELAKLQHDLKKQDERIAEVVEHIERLQRELAQRRAMKLSTEQEIEKFEKIDETELREQIEQAEHINEKVRANQSRQKLLERQTELQKQVDKLTVDIESIDEQKQKQLSDADMPVDGLSFTEDSVLFNDVPFENCSSAEQLKLSVAMGIAMNPKLRIMLIRDGSLLDDDSRKTLRDMAEANEMQVWVEFVGKDEECAIVIEDGLAQEQS